MKKAGLLAIGAGLCLTCFAFGSLPLLAEQQRSTPGTSDTTPGRSSTLTLYTLDANASGVMQTMRQVGGTVGLAMMATIVATVQSDRIESYLESQGESSAQAERLERILSEGGDAQSAATSQISPDVLNTAQDALVSGIGTAYWVGGAVMVASALAALLLLRRVEAVDAPTVDPKPLHPAHVSILGKVGQLLAGAESPA